MSLAPVERGEIHLQVRVGLINSSRSVPTAIFSYDVSDGVEMINLAVNCFKCFLQSFDLRVTLVAEVGRRTPPQQSINSAVQHFTSSKSLVG